MGTVEKHTLVKIASCLNFEKSPNALCGPSGGLENSDQNNAKGTGPASVFEFLTEAFFLCLRTAAEKNSFEDQVCKLPMDLRNSQHFLPVI